MAILSGNEVLAARSRGEISISPFCEDNVNPVSVDLTLGPNVLQYQSIAALDSKASNPTDKRVLREKGSPFVVHPGRLYLMHTLETVYTDRYVPVIDGKSSLGRLGLIVHATAGYGDPGFYGQYTLEVTSLSHQITLYCGMRICQIRFHEVKGEITSYQKRGNYVGMNACGAVPSMSWKQFSDGTEDQRSGEGEDSTA